VKSEAFEILSSFHKKLEDFYEAMDKKYETKKYYERRSHQYDLIKINRSNIVTLSNQITSFVAMFLLEPHNAYQRYYGELLKLYKSQIFQDVHNPFPYYISGVYFSKLDKMFQYGELPSKYKRFKYHILMMLRKIICKNDIPPFNSHEIDKNSELMLKILLSEDEMLKIINDITKNIDTLLNKHHRNLRNLHALPAFTNELLGSDRKNKGKITYYNNRRGFGFLDIGTSNDIYFHIYEYHKSYPDREPHEGEEMTFDIVDNDNGFKAINMKY
jgi:cold shock CspA family protein